MLFQSMLFTVYINNFHTNKCEKQACKNKIDLRSGGNSPIDLSEDFLADKKTITGDIIV